MRVSRTAARVVIAAALVTCVRCGPAGDEPVHGPVTVRALLSHDPPSLSLIGKMDRNSEILSVQITDSLLQYDEHMRLEPRLAESYEQSDDGLTLTFHLRPGVRWHDGREVTAADVVFTVEQIRDPAVENRSFAPSLQNLVSIEALDPRTVRARYSAATADMLEAWRMPLLPRHLAERGADLIDGAFSRHPVGCGPFRFVRYIRQEEIVLEANDEYWDGRPNIDRLVFRIVPDQRTGFQALMEGDLDIMVVTPDLWEEARASPAWARLSGFVYYRLNVWQVTWNMDGSNPFFGDVRVRRAMLLALDREKFIATVVHGMARPGVTSYHPDLIWTDPALEPLPYDPEQAGRLLDEAGWVDSDGDGVRDRDGRRFRFTLLIHAATQRINDEMAVWEQQSWARLGIQVDIEKLEWQRFRERRSAGEFDAAMAGLGFTPNPDQYELYHSSAHDGGFNYGAYDDPEVDRLLEAGRATRDDAERLEIYRRLQHRLHEQQPIACLVYFATPVLHDRRLEGTVPSPIDYWRTTRGPRVWRWAGGAGGGSSP